MPRMVEDRLHTTGMRKGSSSLPFEKCWRLITTRACRSQNFGYSNAILSRGYGGDERKEKEKGREKGKEDDSHAKREQSRKCDLRDLTCLSAL